MSGEGRLASGVRPILAWALASISIASAFFAWHDADPLVRAFQADSETLVVNTLRERARAGAEPAAGFMLAHGTVYVSQVGGQYRFLAAVGPSDPAGLDAFVATTKALLALALAATLGLFAAAVLRAWGAAAFVATIVGCAASKLLAGFAFNAYWCTFLSFLPFAVAWAAHPIVVRRAGRMAAHASYAALVLAKCLCGYEHVTNVVLSVGVAVAYHELAASRGPRRALWSAFQYTAGACAGFFAALALHLLTAASAFGSMRAGLARIAGRVASRTYGDELGTHPTLAEDARRWLEYLWSPVASPIPQVTILAAVGLAWATLRAARRTGPSGQAASWSLGAGLLASLSWNSLALGHMRYHHHLNGITMYLPFDLLAFAFLGHAAGQVARAPLPDAERPAPSLRAEFTGAVLGAALLLWIAAVNGFPLVFSDTGTYLWSGFTGSVPFDRPIGYGLFLRAVSLGTSLWLVVIAQAAIVAAVVALAVRALSRPGGRVGRLVLTLAALAFMTSLPLYAGMLIPDVFSFVALLAFALLASGATVRAGEVFACSVFLVLGSAVHLTNLLSTTALALALLLWQCVAAVRRFPTVPRPRAALVCGLVALSWMAVAASSAAAGGGWTVGRSGSIFYMARLAASGIAQEFLEARCDAHPWRLCANPQEIPHNEERFLWESTSPFIRDGGWSRENATEYRRIIAASLREPRWAVAQGREALRASADQLLSYRISEWYGSYGQGSSPRNHLATFMPGEVPAFDGSLQQTSGLHLGSLSLVQSIAVALSALGVAASILIRRFRQHMGAARLRFVAFVGGSLVVNAIACGALSMVTDRYQARVIPLALLAGFACVWSRRELQADRSPSRFDTQSDGTG